MSEPRGGAAGGSPPGAASTRGLEVDEAGGAARRAGVRPDDVIVTIDGRAPEDVLPARVGIEGDPPTTQ